MFDNIERALGLHQRVNLIYVVDGYWAILEHEEKYPYPRIEGRGKTVMDALVDLDKNIPKGEWKSNG